MKKLEIALLVLIFTPFFFYKFVFAPIIVFIASLLFGENSAYEVKQNMPYGWMP